MTTELFASQEVVPEEIKKEPTFDEVITENFEEGVAQSLAEDSGESLPVKKEEWNGISEDEYKSISAKASKVDDIEAKYQQLHDKTFGTIGQLKHDINTLKQFNQERKPTTATPVSKESFKSLAEYLGDEDMTEALAKDLSALQLGSGQGVSSEDFDAKLAQKTAELNIEFDKKLLSLQHPNWEKTKDTDEFSAWKGTLSNEAQDTLMSTFDVHTLIQAFNSFNSWQNKKSDAETKKQQRLEDAVQATDGRSRGAKAASDDYFNQGLKKALAVHNR